MQSIACAGGESSEPLEHTSRPVRPHRPAARYGALLGAAHAGAVEGRGGGAPDADVVCVWERGGCCRSRSVSECTYSRSRTRA